MQCTLIWTGNAIKLRFGTSINAHTPAKTSQPSDSQNSFWHCLWQHHYLSGKCLNLAECNTIDWSVARWSDLIFNFRDWRTSKPNQGYPAMRHLSLACLSSNQSESLWCNCNVGQADVKVVFHINKYRCIMLHSSMSTQPHEYFSFQSRIPLCRAQHNIMFVSTESARGHWQRQRGTRAYWVLWALLLSIESMSTYSWCMCYSFETIRRPFAPTKVD